MAKGPIYGPVNLSVVKSGYIAKPTLDNSKLTRIGAGMVREQLARWAKHKNAYGNTAKPLSKRYTFIKKRVLGIARPYRDMRGLEGLVIPNFTLRKAANGQIRAENTTRKARQHARQAQGYDEMIGLSGPEQVSILRHVNSEYKALSVRAWIPIHG